MTSAEAGPSSAPSIASSLETRPASLLQHVSDSLSNSAAAKANQGKIRLHVLFSTPRSAKDLYPFAHIDAHDAQATLQARPVDAYVEHVIMTASYCEEGIGTTNGDKSAARQGKLMYALECFLYTIPSHHSALLYVSKLDSTGWGPTPAPKHLRNFLESKSKSQDSSSFDGSTSVTRVITKAFLSHFASLSHWTSPVSRLPDIQHVSIHILARAQAAYLFPSSNENNVKHILSDGGLIKWWRSIVSAVVCSIRRREDEQGKIDARPFYLIPGYDKQESRELLPLPPSLDVDKSTNGALSSDEEVLIEAQWVYGHPYSQQGAESSNLPPLPLFSSGRSEESSDSMHIARLLPHFPDDPKSRFIAELARDSYEHASRPTKRKAEDGVASEESQGKRARVEDGSQEEEAAAAVPSITLKAMRERRSLDAVHPNEFWQRMGFRQECCAGNAVGVFVALFTRRRETRTTADGAPTANGQADDVKGFASQPLALPHPFVPDLVKKHLMRDACDWSKPESSQDLTRAWEDAIRRAIKRKGGRTVHAEHNNDGIGQGIVFGDVTLQGPSQEELAQASREWEEVSKNEPMMKDSVATSAPVVVVNTLSVKRKKVV